VDVLARRTVALPDEIAEPRTGRVYGLSDAAASARHPRRRFEGLVNFESVRLVDPLFDVA
jgi:hypothetical protein